MEPQIVGIDNKSEVVGVGSPRAIRMVSPARVVSIKKWIIDWLRETLSCLHLILNEL